MASQSLRPPLRASNVNVFSRRIKSNIVSGLALLATIIVIAPLIAILFYLLKQGITSLNWNFFTKIPVPAGESGGGMENAIVGSGVVLALASLIGIPLGIGAGIYLAEYAGSTRMGSMVRFKADVLNGVVSIVVGIAHGATRRARGRPGSRRGWLAVSAHH
jgi:phosphate transport system permease protein